MGQDAADGWADDGAFERSLCEPTGEQINVADVAVDAGQEDDVGGRDDVTQVGEIADGR